MGSPSLGWPQPDHQLHRSCLTVQNLRCRPAARVDQPSELEGNHGRLNLQVFHHNHEVMFLSCLIFDIVVEDRLLFES